MMKKIFIVSLIVTSSISNVMAFDLEDYATTYRATRDAYGTAVTTLQQKEAAYKEAFAARMQMELEYRNAQKAIAESADPVDEAKKSESEAEIVKLGVLDLSSKSCGF